MKNNYFAYNLFSADETLDLIYEIQNSGFIASIIFTALSSFISLNPVSLLINFETYQMINLLRYFNYKYPVSYDEGS